MSQSMILNQHSCVTILITIILMAISMVNSTTSYSPYKPDVTGDNQETIRPGSNYNYDNNNELVQYLKDVITVNDKLKHSHCCPELYYYLTGIGSSRVSSPSRSNLFLPVGLTSSSSASSSSSPMDKRMGSEFLGKRMGSEFLGKRVGSEFLGKRVGSEFLGKRMGSEFLG